MNYMEEYARWMDRGAMKEVIERLTENEIKDCFRGELVFGTGGIRAIMGPGPNRMNVYTIHKNTEGYARYVVDKGGKSVVIAYDNRNNSQLFAIEAAKVLSMHGIHVYLFETLRTTPELSFAVRYYGAFGGIVITASHNPPEYNGYKIYDKYGCQCVPRDTDVIIQYINKVEDMLSITVDETIEIIADETGKLSVLSYGNHGEIEICSTNVDEAYYQALLSVQENPGIEKRIRVVYSPLHGTGNVAVRTMLARLGYDVHVVEEQCIPDGNFTNTASPNPENKKAFDKAIELAKMVNADLVVATDPDCDRLGIVVKHNNHYEYLTGNQTGAILLQYILSQKFSKGVLPENGIVFNTIVTSDLGTRICQKYGVEVESTLTGFKYIGDKIREYEDQKIFLFGYEESYGYLIKEFARDKDGVQSTILAAEVCNYYKLQGKTLIDVLNDIYDEFGRCIDIQENQTFTGIEGSQKISDMVDEFRYGDICTLESFSLFEGRRIIAKEDYMLSIRYERTTQDGKDQLIEKNTLTLPKSNVIKLFFEDGSWIVVRPSGNEPMIKWYKNFWIV